MCCTGLALCQEQHTRQGNQLSQHFVMRSLPTSLRAAPARAHALMCGFVFLCVRWSSLASWRAIARMQAPTCGLACANAGSHDCVRFCLSLMPVLKLVLRCFSPFFSLTLSTLSCFASVCLLA